MPRQKNFLHNYSGSQSYENQAIFANLLLHSVGAAEQLAPGRDLGGEHVGVAALELPESRRLPRLIMLPRSPRECSPLERWVESFFARGFRVVPVTLAFVVSDVTL